MKIKAKSTPKESGILMTTVKPIGISSLLQHSVGQKRGNKYRKQWTKY